MLIKLGNEAIVARSRIEFVFLDSDRLRIFMLDDSTPFVVKGTPEQLKDWFELIHSGVPHPDNNRL